MTPPEHPAPESPATAAPSRVLHVLNAAPGGAARTTRALIEGLAAQGIESAIYCHGTASDPGAAALAESVEGRIAFGPLHWWNRKVRAPWWRRPLIAARQVLRTGAGRRSARAVTAFAAAQQVELIHTNTILTGEGAAAARALGIPHVWHVRELVGPGKPFRFWFESRALQRRVVRRADRVVANSAVTAAAFTRLVPDAEVRVVANGLSDPHLEAIAPPLGRHPVVVGMVADVGATWKNHEAFLAALAAVRAEDVRYVLFGNVPAPGLDARADALRRRADELGLAERITFVGPSPDPVQNLAALDVVVHTAAQESFGRVVVEAMLAGRPVVGVDAGGVGELVCDGVTGLLAPVGDARALAAHIDALVADPERRARLGAAGRERARDRHGADAMVDGVVAVYRDVLAARAARAARSDRADGARRSATHR